MKIKIFVLTSVVFALILFTVSCVADIPADISVDVSRSEPQQNESKNESISGESKPEEDSKPAEESVPDEESKPEPTQEEIKALFAEDISRFTEKKKDGYVTKFENYTVQYSREDYSFFVKNENAEFYYHNNVIYALIPNEPYTYVEIKSVGFNTFTELADCTIIDYKWDTFIEHITKTESKIAIKETDEMIRYSAENSYIHLGEYDGKVTTTFYIYDTKIRIVAEYQYGEKDDLHRFSENYTIYLQANTAKKPTADDAGKAYVFENLDEYKAFADKLYAFYGSVYKYKLNNNTLNKAIYADYKGTDSTGGDYYIIEKTVAVGTNDDFVRASKTNYYRLPGELYKYDSYAYVTEESYDYRRIWEVFNYHNADYEYGAVITGEDNESKPGNRIYSDLYVNIYRDEAFFTAYFPSNGELKTDIKNFAIIAGRFDSITYTSNNDGTVTADFTCINDKWTHTLLFGSAQNTNSSWMHPDNDYDYTAFLTYDTETGLMTSLSIYCKATRNDGFWYEHKLEVTVTDADESMLPEKADLLEGNW